MCRDPRIDGRPPLPSALDGERFIPALRRAIRRPELNLRLRFIVTREARHDRQTRRSPSGDMEVSLSIWLLLKGADSGFAQTPSTIRIHVISAPTQNGGERAGHLTSVTD